MSDAIPSRVAGRCDSCKHWESEPYLLERKGWKRCWRIEDDPNHTSDHGPKPESIAYVQDTEGYHADIYTRGEFGCVLWEERGLHLDTHPEDSA